MEILFLQLTSPHSILLLAMRWFILHSSGFVLVCLTNIHIHEKPKFCTTHFFYCTTISNQNFYVCGLVWVDFLYNHFSKDLYGRFWIPHINLCVTISSQDSYVGVWQLPEGTRTQTLTGHNGGVTGISLQGNLAATSSYDSMVKFCLLSKYMFFVNVDEESMKEKSQF